MTICPVCGGEIIVDEDWELGRVSHCGIHYRKVEHFDKFPNSDVLHKEENTDAA